MYVSMVLPMLHYACISPITDAIYIHTVSNPVTIISPMYIHTVSSPVTNATPIIYQSPITNAISMCHVSMKVLKTTPPLILCPK